MANYSDKINQTKWIPMSPYVQSTLTSFTIGPESKMRGSRDSDGNYSVEISLAMEWAGTTTLVNGTAIELVGIQNINGVSQLEAQVVGAGGWLTDLEESRVDSFDTTKSQVILGGPSAFSLARCQGTLLLAAKPTWFDANLDK